MFRPIFRWRKRDEKKSRRTAVRKLFLESLDSRRVLAGVVDVDTTVAGDLTLLGNISNNQVEVHGTPVVGQFVITGKSGTLLTLNGSAQTFPTLTINGIIDDIFVNLDQGQDRFELGNDANPTVVGDDVTITNRDDDVNIIKNADIGDNVSVSHTDNAYGEVQIIDTIVRGNVDVDNSGGATGDGDSKTVISKSEIEGTLTIDNDDGDDLNIIEGTTIGAALFVRPTDFPALPTQPVVNIDNGNGASFTSFTLKNDPDSTGALPPGTLGRPTIFGGIDITNGDPIPAGLIVPPPSAGGANPDSLQTAVDIAVFNQVDFLGDLDIFNFNGHTETVFVNSDFAQDTIGIPAGYGESVTVTNGNGYDVLLVDNTTAPYGLFIDNGGPGQLWGSQTDIRNSEIGDRLSPVDLALSVRGDDGDDVFNINDVSSSTVITGTLALSLLGGDDSVQIIGLPGTVRVDSLIIDEALGGGDDTVFLQNLRVRSIVDIQLFGGADTLQIRSGVTFPGLLVGSIVLDGGVGADFFTIPANIPFFSFEIPLP